uniref:Vitronectin n=1 Tax=Sphenodon punctatus TaxID=8508 RepID=A0A8D0GIG3_SPHPU
MKLLLLVLALSWPGGAFAAEESCTGRCEDGFNSIKKCQCDALCKYYQSCCIDYDTVCKPKVTRGDVFAQPEDDYIDYYSTDIPGGTELPDAAPTSLFYEEKTEVPGPAPEPSKGAAPEPPKEAAPEPPKEAAPEPITDAPLTDVFTKQEELCSGEPFDAFTDLKNGSLYAFRGKYFYELDEKSVLPGYPKLIKDVWGIEGPIDAAFTRINCQGKTYIFKGSQYWRFDDGALDPDYPHSISEGFDGIPNDINAAFALPAQSYDSSERVYFFKGKYYWSYDFANQPSQQDCEQSSPSLVFGHYARLQGDSWEVLLQLLFGETRHSGASSRRYISRDWRGVPSQLDATMAGQIYVPQAPSTRMARRKSRRQRKRYRQHRKPWGHVWGWQDEDSDSAETDLDRLLRPGPQCQPIQSVYFFSGDKYYRLNLQKRRVDYVRPRYPRPIAQYWLGCPTPTEQSI